MSSASFNDELLVFLGQSPTPFHAVANMSTLLEQAGFERLDETLHWQLKKHSSYYVNRNDSALVAIKTGKAAVVSDGLRLAGTHTDSPCLKLKPSSEIHRHGYLQLGVEVYGGPCCICGSIEIFPWRGVSIFKPTWVRWARPSSIYANRLPSSPVSQSISIGT